MTKSNVSHLHQSRDAYWEILDDLGKPSVIMFNWWNFIREIILAKRKLPKFGASIVLNKLTRMRATYDLLDAKWISEYIAYGLRQHVHLQVQQIICCPQTYFITDNCSNGTLNNKHVWIKSTLFLVVHFVVDISSEMNYLLCCSFW